MLISSYSHEPQKDIDTQFLYNIYNRDDSAFIWVYDIKNQKLIKEFIKTPQVLNNSTGILQLPNLELFYFWYYPPHSGKVYVIDLNIFECKRTLPSGTPRYAPKAVYYNDCIYVFGGGKAPEKYNIAQNRWTELSFPRLFHSDQAISIFKESILMCGIYDKVIYKYDILVESYSCIPNPLLTWSIDKIIATGNSRVYIFEWGRMILESGLLDEYAWYYIGKNDIVQYISSFWKYNDGAIFIGVIGYGGGYYCYKFDLSSKKIESMKC